MNQTSTYYLKNIFLLIPALVFYALGGKAQIANLNENFDKIPTKQMDWHIVNNSNPLGPLSWFTGNHHVFTAHSGHDSSYIAANFASTDPEGTGKISTWLITPVLDFKNGGVLKFWTRCVDAKVPDRLQVRLSDNDQSKKTGFKFKDTGDFTILLLDINPGLKRKVYPQVWTEYTVTIPALSGKSTGRIAFRYFARNAGGTGKKSNYIGIDDVSYTAGTLPVTFINFDGAIKNSQAILNWATSNEVNNKGFDVERSLDGINFSTIGFVKGNNNSSQVNRYEFTDNKIVSGANFYRLKQIDLNGNSRYSATLMLDYRNLAWKVMGNPSTKNCWVQLQLDKPSKIAIQIISLNGTLIQTINKGNLSAGTYTIPINLDKASAGIYVVKLTVDNAQFSQKILK